MRDLSQLDDVTVPLSRLGANDDATTVRRAAVDAGNTPAVECASAAGPDNEAYQERFGRYLLQKRLGSGGMAEVFKAVAEGAQGFRRVFVVKRILPAFASSPYFVSLFADEAKLSAMLHHPNLVQVYEFGAVAGIHYLSMEYLDGMDLASVLTTLSRRGERMAPSTAAFVAQQVAHGLAYAHTASDENGQPLHLVHRDVSPENIMMLQAGTVKLFDFGIALSDQRLATSVTQGKVLKGKLGYTSPEQVTGRPMDGRSDIFSLGVVMWEMLTCRRLFAGEDDARTLYNVLERPITPPSKIASGVPKAFDAVVLRALARNPADRYPSADHLAEDLDEVLRVVPHHRTDVPHLLERAFGRRATGNATTTTTVSTGAQPQTEHAVDTETSETYAESRSVHIEEPRPSTASLRVANSLDVLAAEALQPFTPTVLTPRRPSWRHRFAIVPGPLRAAAALAATLLAVTALRSLATPAPTVAVAPVAKVKTSPSRPTVAPLPSPAQDWVARARSNELKVMFGEAALLPPTAPKPPEIQIAFNSPKDAPVVRVVKGRRPPNKPAVRVRGATTAYTHTADVLDAVHVDPFAQ